MSRTDEYSVAVGRISTRMVVTTPPPSSVSAGVPISFEGYLEDVNGNRLADKTIELYVNGERSGHGATDVNGVWAWQIPFPAPGTYALYVHFPGDTIYEGC